MRSPALSVIIPARDEESGIASALAPFQTWTDTEIIVAVDDRCADATAERAAGMDGVRVLRRAGLGRGAALARGVDAANGQMLLLLHADSRVDEGSVRAAAARLDPGTAAVAFRMWIDSPRFVFRLLELGVNLRSKLFGLPYGDQGLLLRPGVLARAGGIRPLRRCEDLDLVLRLRRVGRIRLAKGACVTSARRWERDGLARVTVSNVMTLLRFLLRGGDVSHGQLDTHSRRLDLDRDPEPRRGSADSPGLG